MKEIFRLDLQFRIENCPKTGNQIVLSTPANEEASSTFDWDNVTAYAWYFYLFLTYGERRQWYSLERFKQILPTKHWEMDKIAIISILSKKKLADLIPFLTGEDIVLSSKAKRELVTFLRECIGYGVAQDWQYLPFFPSMEKTFSDLASFFENLADNERVVFVQIRPPVQ